MVVAGNLIFFIVIFMGIIPALFIFLQIWLSKRESKYYGLILPTITFIQSLVMALSILVFSAAPSSGEITTCQINESTGEETCITEQMPNTQIEESNDEVVSILLSAGTVFLTCNIPTGINLLIYRHCRKSLKKKNDLSKMAVLDL